MQLSITRKPSAIAQTIVISILVIAIILSLRAGLADVFGNNAMQKLRNWEKVDDVPSIVDWKFALNNLQRANFLAPSHPDYLDALGHIHEWIALILDGDDPNKALEARRAALNYFELATTQRMVWPYSWSYLVITKQQIGETDVQFEAALVNMIHRGSNDSRIQLVVAEVGLASWNILDVGLQQKIMLTLELALEKNPDQIVEIVKRHRKLKFLCGSIHRTDITNKYCQNTSFNF